MATGKNYNHSCPLCGDHCGRIELTGRDHLLRTEDVIDVIKCDSCGLWRVEYPLGAKGLQSLYPADYKPYFDDRPIRKVDGPKLSHLLRKWHFNWVARGKPSVLHLPLRQLIKIAFSSAITFSQAYRFNPFAFIVENKSVLDVGCADGHFLAEMAAMGWDPSGIEFHPEAVRRAKGRGIQIYEGDFLSVADEVASKRTFDLVTLRQVLEHFDDPLQVLRKVKSLLNPGGFAAIWTPVTDGLAPKYFKDNWYNLDVPRHRVLFSLKTLRAMLLQAGFVVHFAGNISSTKSITESVLNQRRKRANKIDGRTGLLLNALAKPIVKILDALLLGDNILMIARKT